MPWLCLIDWDWPLTFWAVGFAILMGLALLLGTRDRGAGITVIVILGIIAGWLALSRDESDYQRSEIDIQLKAVRLQLADLADLLRSYKARHGRYPTNDEGLGVLENYAVRFAAPVVPPGGTPSSDQERRWRQMWLRPELEVEWFTTESGRPLAYQREMAAAYGLAVQAPGTEIAVGKNAVLALRSGQPCSPWWIPYVYENGQGQSSDALANSPARFDQRRLYSVEVERDVYVWSVGGKVLANELGFVFWREQMPRIFAGFMLIVAVAIAILWTIRYFNKSRQSPWVAIIISLLVGVGLKISTVTTCYVMMHNYFRRTPRMLAIQKQLLARYREAGVITDVTYQRALAAAALTAGNPTPSVSPPMTGPASSTGSGQATQPGEGR